MKKSVLVALCGVLLATASYAQDAVNLSQAQVWNSPADVASWPVTTRIEQIIMRPQGAANDGLEFFFSRRQNWPDFWNPGWSGPLNYTVWAGVRINGVWHVSGIIQFWSARVSTGAPILANNNFAVNWVYDGRWGAMNHYQPVAGEAMIFFVTAGDARGHTTVTSVRERSNVVMVNLPANDSGTFTFASAATDLILDEGSVGIKTLLDSSTYAAVHPYNPENIVAGDFDGNNIDDIAIDFGPGVGLWLRMNGVTWVQLHGASPTVMAAGDLDGNGRDELALGFAGAGLWIFNGGAWGQWHGTDPTRLLVANINGVGGSDLVIEFPGAGVWVVFDASSWGHAHPQNTVGIIAANVDGQGSDDLLMAFPGAGTWILRNGTSWVQIHPAAASKLAAGKIDGDGRADVVFEFAGYGLWLLRNLSSWAQLHPLSARHIVVAELDGNSKDEVIIDFGPGAGLGVYVYANDANWLRITPSSFEQIVPAQLN